MAGIGINGISSGWYYEGSVNQSQLTRKIVAKDVARSSDRVSEEATIGGVESEGGIGLYK